MRKLTMKIRTAIMASAMMCVCSFASADETVADFNTAGDQEGFYDFQGGGGERITGETVSGGVLSGTTASGDSQFRKFTTDGNDVGAENNFSFNVADFVAIEIKMLVDFGGDGLSDTAGGPGNMTLVVYETDPTGSILTTNPVSLIWSSGARDLTADNSMQTYRFNFNADDFPGGFPTFETGVVEGLRLDVVNGPASIGSTFQVDSITLISAEAEVLLGDVDLSGEVDFLDISPFIAVLSAGTFQAEADANEDGEVDFLDISPFIAILSN